MYTHTYVYKYIHVFYIYNIYNVCIIREEPLPRKWLEPAGKQKDICVDFTGLGGGLPKTARTVASNSLWKDQIQGGMGQEKVHG